MSTKRTAHKLGNVLCVVATVLLVVAAAIAVPILLRPFYYMQIGPLRLERSTGLERAVIRQAYDEVMDYLVLGRPFGTGQLAYSAAGKSHFEDCRGLFVLDFWVIGVTVGLLLLLWALRALARRGQPSLSVPRQRQGHLPVFWAAVLCCALFVALAVWGAVSFDSLFTAFHRVFFPGKTNWVFDPAQDAIINILPQRFFLHCAALIVGIIFVTCLCFFVVDARWRRRQTDTGGLRWRRRY